METAASPDGDADEDPARRLVALYDSAVVEVHHYLHRRCGSRLLAEDLTAETFMAAVTSIERGRPQVTTAWLIGIARHKLVDHWRRQEREQRRLHAVAGQAPSEMADEWDVVLDQHLAHDVLAGLSASHRAVLTLRYLDGLPVAEVAACLDRTHGATEALLTRAKGAFRTAYSTEGGQR